MDRYALITRYHPPHPELGDVAHCYITDDLGNPLTEAEARGVGETITAGSDPPQTFTVMLAEATPEIA